MLIKYYGSSETGWQNLILPFPKTNQIRRQKNNGGSKIAEIGKNNGDPIARQIACQKVMGVLSQTKFIDKK